MASAIAPARSTDAGALDASQTVQFMLPSVKLARWPDHVEVPPRAYKTLEYATTYPHVYGVCFIKGRTCQHDSTTKFLCNAQYN